jgi:oxygen-independent coproporphyrinogen-3 oxidase
MAEYFARELAQLAPMAEAGLVALEPGAVQVTATGWYVVRAVAMVFDGWLQRDTMRERFSRMI